jgi:predicted MFS family arabinose efflux permease
MMELKSQISQRLSLISNRQYRWNVLILSIMWTASSFSFYLLMFMNKYYEGSLYVNYYLDGVAGILGSCLSSAVYGPIKMRWSFILSISITLIGSVCLLIFQQGYASSNWISVFMPDDKKSPYPEGSH